MSARRRSPTAVARNSSSDARALADAVLLQMCGPGARVG
jgi:hypothetical protein